MKKTFLLLALILSVFLFASLSSATVITFSLNKAFTGKPDPDGSAPWLTAKFDDQGSAGSVYLTLTGNLTSPNFVSDWYFNLDPALTLTSGAFVAQAGNTAPAATVTVNPNNLNADGAQGFGFDIKFAFPTSNAPNTNRFDGTETITYLITGTGLTAASFNYLNNATSLYYSAAHIQSISDVEGSTYIGTGGTQVPEPGTMFLLGGSLIALGAFAIRRKSVKI